MRRSAARAKRMQHEETPENNSPFADVLKAGAGTGLSKKTKLELRRQCTSLGEVITKPQPRHLGGKRGLFATPKVEPELRRSDGHRRE